MSKKVGLLMDYLWTHFSKILILGECFIERRQEHAGVRPHGPRHEVRISFNAKNEATVDQESDLSRGN